MEKPNLEEIEKREPLYERYFVVGTETIEKLKNAALSMRSGDAKDLLTDSECLINVFMREVIELNKIIPALIARCRTLEKALEKAITDICDYQETPKDRLTFHKQCLSNEYIAAAEREKEGDK